MKQCAHTAHLEIIYDHVAARLASVYGQYAFTDWIIVPLKLNQGAKRQHFCALIGFLPSATVRRLPNSPTVVWEGGGSKLLT